MAAAILQAAEEDWQETQREHDARLARLKHEIDQLQEEGGNLQAQAEESRQKLPRIEATIANLTQTIQNTKASTEARRTELMESATNFHSVRLRLLSASAEKAGGFTKARTVLEETLFD
ncbi:hypothetical protein WJX74_007493 [Apatococcus lobatus]|uniref:Uncharacterized protein n=1 Tax=Apatococcus lobatus TaxID=904363 RepID=A0AAW1S648_9CHLO